jgi:hypothetical protein
MRNRSLIGALFLSSLGCHCAVAEPSPKIQDLPIPPTPEPLTPQIQDVVKPIAPDEVQFSTQEAQTSKILNALQKSSERYPAFVNPTGDLTSIDFAPKKLGNTTNVEIRVDRDRAFIQNISSYYFPKQEQLYWVLPGNRIVIETKGWQGSLKYQGRETNRITRETLEVTQSLWGLQAAWLLPQSFDDLISNEEIGNASVLSIAAEVNNLEGIPVPAAAIKTRPETDSTTIKIPRLGTGTTYSPTGGGSLFDSLEIGNAPKVIQAFPTNNLQVLVEEGEGLFTGAKIPKEALLKAGIAFGNPFTGDGFEFQPEVTSIPGIKTAQLYYFDNFDLLNVLVNPFLEQKQRDLHYLNSLHWLSFGVKDPKVLSSSVEDNSKDWHQLKFSRPHNRTVLQYEKQPGQATFYSVFSNPGAALSISLGNYDFNFEQTLNSSLGLLLGSIFEFIRPHKIEKSIWEGKLRSGRGEAFTPLRSRTTSEQRKQINQRLERSLNFAMRNSGLSQVSGAFNFPSRLTPEKSSIFQIRTGNHQRRVRPIQIDQTWIEGDTYISKLRLSNETFGPLSLIGTPIPSNQTSLPQNRASSVQTFISTRDQIFELTEQLDSTVVPIQIRSFDTAFDRMELSQVGQAITHFTGFDGYFHLPTVEALWSGTKRDFSYSLSLGSWVNFNANTAPHLQRNDFGEREPKFGIYTNALLNWTKNRIILGKSQQVRAIATSIPAIQASWNSAATPLNPSYTTLSYSYLYQTEATKFSTTSGVFLAVAKRLEPIGFIRGQLGLKSGLTVSTTLEVGDNFFGSFEGLQKISDRWSVGLYGQNFETIPGLNSRITGKAFGVLVERRSRSGVGWRSRVGMNGDQFEIQFEGGIAF